MKKPAYPCLWFDGQAQEAANFYCSVFENSKIFGNNGMVVNFELNGQEFMGLNGGPDFKFNPAISFFVMCETIDEVNEKWEKLIDGGEVLMPIDKYDWSERYGWLTDKFGVSWQINYHEEGVPQKNIVPSLLFTQNQLGNAKKALEKYTTIFKNSTVILEAPYPKGSEFEGMLMYSNVVLNDSPIVLMDGPSDDSYFFNEAISFVIKCDDQAEIDYYWEKLTENGGQESRCGWLKDQFGVSWQVVPAILGDLMNDPSRSQRVMQAFLQMNKFDIQKLLDA